MLRRIIVFLIAIVAATVLAAAASSQFVLSELSALGVNVPLSDRLAVTMHDVIGMFPLFGSIVAVGFLLAFLVAGGIARWLPSGRTALFVLAGASAIVVALLIMRASLGLMPVAGARSTFGLIVQGLAGATGGWCFAAMTRRSEPQ